jgi:hypothetical protein
LLFPIFADTFEKSDLRFAAALRYRAFCPNIIFGKVFANFDACFLATVPKSLEFVVY